MNLLLLGGSITSFPFPYILPACSFPGICCPLINGTQWFLPSQTRVLQSLGWSWLYHGLLWGHPSKVTELHAAQMAGMPHNCIQD